MNAKQKLNLALQSSALLNKILRLSIKEKLNWADIIITWKVGKT